MLIKRENMGVRMREKCTEMTDQAVQCPDSAGCALVKELCFDVIHDRDT